MSRVRERAFTVPSRRREPDNEEEVIEVGVEAVEEAVKKKNKGKRDCQGRSSSCCAF